MAAQTIMEYTTHLLFLALCQLLTLPLQTYAQPMSGYHDASSSHHDIYDSIQSDSLWSDSSRYSFTELLSSDRQDASYTCNDLDASQDGMQISSHAELSAKPPLPYNEWIKTQPHLRQRKERKGKHYVDRELGYARVRLGRANMKPEEWRELIEHGDPQAVKIRLDFDAKCEKESKYAGLQRRLKKNPNDVNLLAQLKDFDVSEEYYLRQRFIAENKLPLSKPKRDRLNALIHKVRGDIEDHNALRPLRSLKPIMAGWKLDKMKQVEAEKCSDPKHAPGNANADQIIADIEEMRNLLRLTPFHGDRWNELWLEVDEWMQLNQLNYITLGTPLFVAALYDQHATVAGYTNVSQQGQLYGFEDEQTYEPSFASEVNTAAYGESLDMTKLGRDL